MMKHTLRRGDVISVRAKVRHETIMPEESYVHATVGDRQVMVAMSDVVAFLYPAVDEGDVVRLLDDHEQGGKVVAVIESGGDRFVVVERGPGRIVLWTASAVEIETPAKSE